MQCKLRWIVTCRINNTWIHFESRSTLDHSSIRWMPVLHSLPLFGLNADFFAMSLDCDSGTNILWMHLLHLDMLVRYIYWQFWGKNRLLTLTIFGPVRHIDVRIMTVFGIVLRLIEAMRYMEKAVVGAFTKYC